MHCLDYEFVVVNPGNRFPKQSKDAIKDTLGAIAERVGKSEKDKRWVVRR